jgi:hypothetical protein
VGEPGFFICGSACPLKLYLEIFFRNFDKYNRLHRFKKLYRKELVLNPAFCRSLYGFNPLTITPNRESVFKNWLLFLLKKSSQIKKNIKGGLKSIWFFRNSCKKSQMWFFVIFSG